MPPESNYTPPKGGLSIRMQSTNPQPAACDLSIIIVNWNTREMLAECLSSLERANVGTCKRSNVETFVVDNASTDGSAGMVRQRFPWVRLIENAENVGFARANNQAISQSQCRYVLLLNSDAQLRVGLLESMIQHLEADPTTGITGVCQVFPDGRSQFCYGRFPTLWREARALLGLHRWDLSPLRRLDTPRPVDWVSGACLMVRREVLEQIGLLDETFFMFGEEVDLCYRATEAGWKVCLVPSPPLLHVRAGSTGKTPERILRLYRGKLRYFQKHQGVLRSWVLLALFRLATAAKLVLYGVLSVVRPAAAPQRRLWAEVFEILWKNGLV